VTATKLNVIVPSVNGWKDLEGCLAALDKERLEFELEVIVVDRLGPEVQNRAQEAYPAIQLIVAPQEATIPEMRALALEAATAPWVAVIEDHVIVPMGWAQSLVEVALEGHPIVAGSVENIATGTLVDRTAFLCEYHHLLPPIPQGEVGGVAGNNVVYSRSLLAEHEEAWRAGRWEDHLHASFVAAGESLWCEPSIVVGHKMHYRWRDYFSQRYLYARSYAGARVKGEPLAKRLLYGGAAFILPLLLLWRICRTIWSKRKFRGQLLWGLPLLASFVAAWGMGEMMGYWFGAGTSLRKVK